MLDRTEAAMNIGRIYEQVYTIFFILSYIGATLDAEKNSQFFLPATLEE